METMLLTQEYKEEKNILKNKSTDHEIDKKLYNLNISSTNDSIIFKCKEIKKTFFKKLINPRNNKLFSFDYSNLVFFYNEYHLKDFININKIFNIEIYKTIDDIYEEIINLIDDKKFKIILGDNKLVINFEFSVNRRKIPVEFELSKRNIKQNEITKLFCDDFNKQIEKNKNLLDKNDELLTENIKLKNEINKLKSEIDKLNSEIIKIKENINNNQNNNNIKKYFKHNENKNTLLISKYIKYIKENIIIFLFTFCMNFFFNLHYKILIQKRIIMYYTGWLVVFFLFNFLDFIIGNLNYYLNIKLKFILLFLIYFILLYVGGDNYLFTSYLLIIFLKQIYLNEIYYSDLKIIIYFLINEIISNLIVNNLNQIDCFGIKSLEIDDNIEIYLIFFMILFFLFIYYLLSNKNNLNIKGKIFLNEFSINVFFIYLNNGQTLFLIYMLILILFFIHFLKGINTFYLNLRYLGPFFFLIPCFILDSDSSLETILTFSFVGFFYSLTVSLFYLYDKGNLLKNENNSHIFI